MTNEPRLRLVLRANAATSAACGALMTLAPRAVDDVLDTGHPGWIRIVGIGLLPFAAGVAWLSTSSARAVRRQTPRIIAGDAGWVLGSLVTIAFGWYAADGAVLVGVMAAVVGVWAVTQWLNWRPSSPSVTTSGAASQTPLGISRVGRRR